MQNASRLVHTGVFEIVRLCRLGLLVLAVYAHECTKSRQGRRPKSCAGSSPPFWADKRITAAYNAVVATAELVRCSFHTPHCRDCTYTDVTRRQYLNLVTTNNAKHRAQPTLINSHTCFPLSGRATSRAETREGHVCPLPVDEARTLVPRTTRTLQQLRSC